MLLQYLSDWWSVWRQAEASVLEHRAVTDGVLVFRVVAPDTKRLEIS